MQLRDFQARDVAALRSALSGAKSVVYVAPTASGKTVTSAHIMENALSKGKRVLFLAHRRELVVQAFEKLQAFGVTAGIWMAGFSQHMYRKVQVGSVQTITAQLKKGRQMPKFDLIITDECHRALAKSYMDIYEKSEAFHIGLTATPIRSDGRGLGEVYDKMVMAPTVRELTAMGYLVPARYFAPSKFDLEGVKMSGSDYSQPGLDKAVLKQGEIIGDVVANWLRIGEDRKTILYAPGVKSSVAFCEAFNEAGVAAEHIDGTTPGDERKAILGRHRSGETKIITNAMVLVEGYDDPSIACAIIACPTRFLGKWLQMGGRALRVHPDKQDALILDHGGCLHEHGRLDDLIPWTLDCDKDAPTIKELKGELDKKEPKEFTCSKCHMVFSGKLHCPNCGTKIQMHGVEVVATDADLVEWTREGESPMEKRATQEYRESFYGQLLTHANDKGYNPKWAGFKFKEKFKEWPEFEGKPEPVGAEVKRYITYLNIRAAHARRKK